MYEAQIIEAAHRRYQRDLRHSDWPGQQPSSGGEVEEGHVVLSNVNGELARYRYAVAAGGHLRLTALERGEQPRAHKAYEEVCEALFPRWKPWGLSVGGHLDELRVDGQADPVTRTIHISTSVARGDDLELRLVLVHEVAHAVTSPSHGARWRQRMLKAAAVADDTGWLALGEAVRDEVQMYADAPKVTAAVAYGALRDVARHVAYEDAIRHTAARFGLSDVEFTGRYARARRVYDAEVRQWEGIRAGRPVPGA